MNVKSQILIIDDDKGICSTLSDIFRDENYSVKDFNSGKEAMDFIAYNPFNIVIVDLRLPDINGMELLEKIKLVNPEAAVIIMTGHASTGTAVKALNAGAYAYVVKPFDIDELKTIVKKSLKEIRLSQQNKKLIDQLQKTNRDLEKYKKSLEIAVEKAEKMSQKASAATEAKSRFLATMSHEIRTPMNSIIGFSDLLAEENLTKQQCDYVSLIKDGGHHLLGLINDILDFSKIEAGKLDMEKAECPIEDVLKSIKSMMQTTAFNKGLDFSINAKTELPTTIYTDKARLKQCLINLINNAIKFTSDGYVHLNISLEHQNNETSIRFDVEDTGIGIPENIQKTIFESFTQADGSTSRKYGGSGLGLAITKQLVILLGGDLSLTSEQDNGSIFSITMPVGLDVSKQLGLDWNKSEQIETKCETTNVKLLGKVLVAEDVKSNQKLITLLLEKMGLNVTVVENGIQAVEKITSENFDLVLMDIQMPNMNGYEATKAIREQGIKIPIIALTANAMRCDDEKCFKVGCDNYLSKPIDRKILIEIMTKYLGKKIEQAETSELQVNYQHNDKELEAKDSLAVDMEHLWDCGLDEKVAKEIMITYIDDSSKTLLELEKAVQIYDIESIKLAAHSLKGSSANMGAKKLSEISQELEQMAKKKNLLKIEWLCNELEKEFDRVKNFASKPDWIETAKA